VSHRLGPIKQISVIPNLNNSIVKKFT